MHKQVCLLLTFLTLSIIHSYADGPAVHEMVDKSAWIIRGRLGEKTLLHRYPEPGLDFYKLDIHVDQVLKSPTPPSATMTNITIVYVKRSWDIEPSAEPAVGTAGFWFAQPSKPHLKISLIYCSLSGWRRNQGHWDKLKTENLWIGI